MISKSELKLLSSYKQKKFRDQDGIFTIEGVKCVNELLSSDFEVLNIYALDSWESSQIKHKNNITRISQSELERISNLSTPDKVLAVAKKKPSTHPECKNVLSLALDTISNPGNLGTIIRVATWFGVKNIICNHQTVDCYNPKVVQATMGALFHSNIYYTDLEEFLDNQDKTLPIYGTVLTEGSNIYQQKLATEGIIIIGNESRGISPQIKAKVSHPITIPCFAPQGQVESLNASIATAIILSEFHRSAEQAECLTIIS